MGRLVVVSNRVPDPRERGPTAGGLAVALQDALARRDVLWFGWSGRTAEATAERPTLAVEGRTTYARLDLGRKHHQQFYVGFANGALWPALHYRVGLAQFAREDYAGYRQVNGAFATALKPLLRSDDVIWVHDFHLFPLGVELRACGAAQRLGFFLHVPFPPWALFSSLPRARELAEDLAAYDVIGVQTEGDAENLRDALCQVSQSAAAGRVQAFPISIDAAGFGALAERAVAGREAERLRDSLSNRALLLGIDRLDYSKGLQQRFCGYGQLLARFPAHRRQVTYLQVAPVSRGEVAHYRTLRRELDELAGRINGQHAEYDWAPIRWITRAVPRPTLAGFMRLSRVGVVTPLRDGMNLVAKEFVVAQDPRDPGALVLSRFAGVADELGEAALLVNPLDPDEIADALDQALTMSLEERIARWRRMNATVQDNSAAAWCARFLTALEAGGMGPSSASRAA